MRIAYLGHFSFPASHANSLRVMGMSRTLARGGSDVVIGSADHGVPVRGRGDSEGGGIHPLGEFPQPDWPRWKRALRSLDAGHRAALWMENLDPKPDVILVYGTLFGYLRRLLPLAKIMRVPLVLDAVEWYQPSHLSGGRFGPLAMAFEYSMRHLAPQADGVIAISRYLETYFKGRGVPTIRIPPLFSPDPPRPPQYRDLDAGLHLCYAGTPGRKDKLGVVLHAIASLGKDASRISFHLVGLGASELDLLMKESGLDSTSGIRNCRIMAHGLVDNSTARLIVASCDFTVLLRDRARFSMAGFPSKVAESMVLGTPVMANLSSNLDEVLADGGNAIVVSQPDVACVATAIERALRLGCDDVRRMKESAGKDGIRLFDPEQYVACLGDFMEARVKACTR